ncbi:hypothetical protein O181_008154 [Austropuccinia psidii MF-1]|uniref:Uncharacterized protein n=1 Tax=Austropuccinia psidii MF-1 TaxID=1389203 RepID=A0A9Q3BNC1_9BASI|nr:hypothetical protein [Austropuccinia psidii MF-1]
MDCYQVLATKCPHCDVGDLVESNEIYSSKCDKHLRCANTRCPTIFQLCDGQAPLYWLVCDKKCNVYKVAPMVDADCGADHRTRLCTSCNHHAVPQRTTPLYRIDEEHPHAFSRSSDYERSDDGENHQ